MRTLVSILSILFSASLFAAGHDLPSSQAQVRPIVTGDGPGFMAAWVASGPNGESVEWRAVRGDGEATDGAGTAPEKTYYPSVAIAHSPSDALVVWIADRNIHVQHLSPSGTALSTIAISSGEHPRDVAVAWNSSRYFVVWATESRILGALIAPEGTPAPPVLLNEPFFTEESLERSPITPDVAWDGRNFIVVFAEVNNFVCTQTCPTQYPDQHRVMRVSADGKPVDPSPIVLKGSYLRAHVASSGAESLIALDRANQVSTIVAHDAGGLTLDAETPLFLWSSNVSSAVVWDGAAYTVGWRYRAPDSGPSWMGAAHVTRSGLAFDYRVVATGWPIYAEGLPSWGPSMAVSDTGVTAFVISEVTAQYPQARMYLASEFATMPAPPPPPRNVISYFGGNTSRIEWQLSDTAAGYVVESQFEISKEWYINAVVPAYLNTATVYARVGSLLRVCALGPGGISEGTITSIGSIPRRRAARQ
jgi:hypothetical protein